MKKYAVLPFAALAFATACSDTSQNPLAAPDQAPVFHHDATATPVISNIAVGETAPGVFSVTVTWLPVAGATEYKTQLVRCPGGGTECGAPEEQPTTGLSYTYTGVTSGSGRLAIRVIAYVGNHPNTSTRCVIALEAASTAICITDDSGTGGGTVNGAPVAVPGGPYTVAEGTQLVFDGSGSYDADLDDLTYEWDFNYDGTFNAEATGVGPAKAWGDNGSYTVGLRVRDGTDYSTVAITTVTISNVVPSRTSSSWAYNPFTGVANASVSFSDPGWLDVVTADFSGIPNPVPNTAGSLASGALIGTFTTSQTLTACVTDAISVRVADDDGDYFDHEFAAANTLERYTAGFMAPIKSNARNVVKHGNVIPVKTSVLDCNGAPVANRQLAIRLANGVGGTTISDESNAVVVGSVSGADTNGIMRVVDGHYMYNMATKNLGVNFAYTIVISDSTHGVIATAVIDLKK